METAAARKRRPRAGSALRRSELIDLAAEAFSQSGYRAATMRDIGEMAGIKAASFYHHFTNKEELLSVIVSETLDEIFQALLKELSSNGTAVERLKAVIRRHMLFSLEHRTRTKVVFEEARFLNNVTSAMIRERQRSILNIYRMLLQDMKDAEGIVDLDVSIASLNILSVIHGLYRWHRPGGRYDDSVVITETIDTLFLGLLKR